MDKYNNILKTVYSSSAIIDVDFKEDTYTRSWVIDGERTVIEKKKGFKKFIKEYGKQKIRPSDQDEFNQFWDEKVLIETFIRSNYLITREYIEYNGKDAWDLVNVFLSCELGSEEVGKFLIIHTVVKHNVSVIQGTGNAKEMNMLLEMDDITGLAIGYSFLQNAEKRINESDDEFSIIHVEINEFKLFNRKYGRNAGNRLLTLIGNFLKNVDAVYNTFSGYDGGDNFNILLKTDNAIINHIESGIKNLVTEFEGIKIIKPIFGGCKIKDKSEAIKDVVDNAAIACNFYLANESRINWYDQDTIDNQIINDRNENSVGFVKVKNIKSRIKTKVDEAFEGFFMEFIEYGDNTDESIDKLLETIRSTYDFDTAFILVALPHQKGMKFEYEAIKEASFSQLSEAFPFQPLVFNKGMERVKERNLLEIPLTTSELGIVPNLMETVYVRDDVIDGAVGVSTYYQREWTAEEREVVRRMGLVLGSLVKKLRINYIENALESMETVDVLTGLFNRNSYERSMDNLPTVSKGTGVIYADLNNLKETNDELGHDAGDKLLCKAANIFMTTFNYQNIFRFGGDEFVVVETDITKKEFSDRIKVFKQLVEEDKQLSIAIGTAWKKNRGNISELIRSADEMMYENKRKYKEKKKDT